MFSVNMFAVELAKRVAYMPAGSVLWINPEQPPRPGLDFVLVGTCVCRFMKETATHWIGRIGRKQHHFPKSDFPTALRVHTWSPPYNGVWRQAEAPTC